MFYISLYVMNNVCMSPMLSSRSGLGLNVVQDHFLAVMDLVYWIAGLGLGLNICGLGLALAT